MTIETFFNDQNAKKGMSDSPGLVDFAWVIEFSFLIAQWKSDSFGGNLNYRRTLINPGHQQMFFRLVKMASCKTDSLCTLITHRLSHALTNFSGLIWTTPISGVKYYLSILLQRILVCICNQNSRMMFQCTDHH